MQSYIWRHALAEQWQEPVRHHHERCWQFYRHFLPVLPMVTLWKSIREVTKLPRLYFC